MQFLQRATCASVETPLDRLLQCPGLFMRHAEGFTLVEVLVAMTLLAIAMVGLGGLVVVSALSTRVARIHTWTTMLAADKLDHLQTTPDLELSTSPNDSLARDRPGFVDYLDAAGRVAASPASSVFVRRWKTQPLPADPFGSWILQVLVTIKRSSVPAASPVRVGRWPGDAFIASLRTKRAG